MGWFEDATAWVNTAVSDAVDFVEDAAEDVGDAVEDAATAIGGAIQDVGQVVDQAAAATAQAASAVAQTVAAVAAGAAAAVVDRVGDVVDAVEAVVDRVGDAVEAVVDRVGDTVEAVVDQVIQTADTAVNWMEDAFENVGDAVDSLLNGPSIASSIETGGLIRTDWSDDDAGNLLDFTTVDEFADVEEYLASDLDLATDLDSYARSEEGAVPVSAAGVGRDVEREESLDLDGSAVGMLDTQPQQDGGSQQRQQIVDLDVSVTDLFALPNLDDPVGVDAISVSPAGGNLLADPGDTPVLAQDDGDFLFGGMAADTVQAVVLPTQVDASETIDDFAAAMFRTDNVDAEAEKVWDDIDQ